MGEERVNRHLHRARERLKDIPRRAEEQEWETDDPLLSEAGMVIAETLIAQAEINQETLHAIRRLSWKITGIDVRAIRRDPQVSYSDIRAYIQEVADREVERRMKEQTSFLEQLFRKWFGEGK